MKIEIEWISNGWVVKHDVTEGIWNKEVYFKTINQATSYAKKIIEKYQKQNE
jgi:hypothetical protein